MALTINGYQRRTYDEILSAKILRAKELFGEDIDTSGLTALGKFIRINAYDQAQVEEELEAVYYARFPNTASGQALDRLLVFGGLSRNPAKAAVYSVRFTGTAGHTVPVGFLVGTDTGVTYYVTRAGNIDSDGACVVSVQCTQAGVTGNVAASAIARIINPDADITAVAGQSCASSGSDAESDASLRGRLQTAFSGATGCNEDAIRAALLRVPTVSFAAVVVNDTDAEDADGRPPHSFECFVLGGADHETEIAQAIFDKRPVGISTHGDESAAITDATGNTKTVYFSYSPKTQITIKVTLSVSAAYPSDGADRITAAVTARINGLGIGGSLVLSTLYGAIYAVPGVAEVTAITASTDGGASYSASNITIPSYGVAVCAAVNVEVAAS